LLLRPALWRLERQLLCRNGHGGREHGAHGGKRDEHSNEHGLPCHVGHAFPSADRTRYGNNSQVSPTPALPGSATAQYTPKHALCNGAITLRNEGSTASVSGS